MTDKLKLIIAVGAGALTGYALWKYKEHVQKTSIAPLKKAVEEEDKKAAEEEKSNLGGHPTHGGGMRPPIGGRTPYFPVPLGYPAYYNPDIFCRFKDAKGRITVSRCDSYGAPLELQNT